MPRLTSIKKSFPFSFGVTEGKDKRQLLITELDYAENCIFREKDSISLCEEYGKIITLPKNIFSFRKIKNQTLLFSPTEVFKVNLRNKSYNKIGDYLNAKISNYYLHQSNKDILYPDIHSFGESIYTVFQTDGKIFFNVFNTEDRLQSQSSKNIGIGIKPRVLRTSNTTVIVYLDGTTFKIYVENPINSYTTEYIVGSAISDFKIVQNGFGFDIHWKQENSFKRIFYNLQPNTGFSTLEDDGIKSDSFYKINKTDKVVNEQTLNRFNLWTSFNYNNQLYKIYWNGEEDQRGSYFIVNPTGKIVGKFLGNVAPQNDVNGVEFNGEVQVIGTTIYLPALHRSVIRQKDIDEIYAPTGLSLIEIEIDENNFIGSLDSLEENQVLLGSSIVKMTEADRFSEFGFSEFPKLINPDMPPSVDVLNEEVDSVYEDIDEDASIDINLNQLESGYDFSSVKADAGVPDGIGLTGVISNRSFDRFLNNGNSRYNF